MMFWFALPVGLYVLLVLAAAWSVRRPRPAPSAPASWPEIAVLVAARNEEHTLPACLDALLAQDYPADRFSILVADDHSTDDTAAIIAHYARRDPRVRYVAVPDPEPGTPLHGKALALHTAIRQTPASLLLTTDADCRPPPEWARSVVAYFADEKIGAVCGITVTKRDTMFSHAQTLDWLFLLGACAFFAEENHPVTAMGNNLSIRRAAYDAVGGYPALPFSVTEDYALFRAIYLHPDWRVRFPLDPGLRNLTLPHASFADVLNQRKRWIKGGLRTDFWLYPVYAMLWLAHVLPPLLLFVHPLLGAGLWGARLLADDLFLRPLARRFQQPLSARAFLLFEGMQTAYVALLPFLLLLRPNIRWKGRTH